MKRRKSTTKPPLMGSVAMGAIGALVLGATLHFPGQSATAERYTVIPNQFQWP